MNKNFTKSFLIILVLAALYVAYLIFRPFLIEMFVAAILVSVFYTPFQKLTKAMKGRRNLAALIMCFFLLLVIIIPSIKLVSYASQKSVGLYASTLSFFESNNPGEIFQSDLFKRKDEIGDIGNSNLPGVLFSEFQIKVPVPFFLVAL